jgi:large subunit ribosomal protein L22
MAIQAHATAKYVRTSAQKAGLVLDQIRGRDVNHALATLRFARKAVARDILKVLRSAVANAQQKDGFAGDVDRLFVAACYANQGPSQKRIRPAPMGRAFRIVKRTAHLTVQVAERPSKTMVTMADEGESAADGAAPKRTRGATRKAAPKKAAKSKSGGTKKKPAAKSGARKKTPAKKTSAKN